VCGRAAASCCPQQRHSICISYGCARVKGQMVAPRIAAAVEERGGSELLILGQTLFRTGA
jgi:hypothetical protein